MPEHQEKAKRQQARKAVRPAPLSQRHPQAPKEQQVGRKPKETKGGREQRWEKLRKRIVKKMKRL